MLVSLSSGGQMRRSWARFEAGDVFFKYGVMLGHEELIWRCFRGFYFFYLGKSENRRNFLSCGFSCLGSWEPFPSITYSFWTLFKSEVMAVHEELIWRCFRDFYFYYLSKSENRRNFLSCGFSCLGSWKPFPSFSCSFWTILSPFVCLVGLFLPRVGGAWWSFFFLFLGACV